MFIPLIGIPNAKAPAYQKLTQVQLWLSIRPFQSMI